MNKNDEAGEGQNRKWWEKLIELDRIEKEGPTLKVVAENMRSLLACVAMFVAVGLLFNHESNHWFYKVIAVFWALWTSFYAALASFQAAMIIGFAVTDGIFKIFHPDLTQKYRWPIALFVGCGCVLLVLGTLLLMTVSVSRTLIAR